jgi:putative membrane protein (TIGR04086 family)
MLTLLIIIIGSLISSILYYFNITSDKINNILLYLISIAAIFTGSLSFAKNMNYKGIISGLIYFAFWFIIMLLLSIFAFKATFSINSIIYYGIVLIFSLLAGVIGKNVKEENDDIC